MTMVGIGAITAEQARNLAIATLGEAVKGEDPAEERVQRRKALTVKELCDRYLAAADKGLYLGKAIGQKSEFSLRRSKTHQSPYRAAAWHKARALHAK
jgi:hypothetical protein